MIKAPQIRFIKILGGYVCLNLLAIILMAQGIIRPPWTLFFFLSFIAPAIMAILILALQGVGNNDRKPGWKATVGGLLFCGLIALANLWLFGIAAASV